MGSISLFDFENELSIFTLNTSPDRSENPVFVRNETKTDCNE
jgi:hypothetical protein